jgi:CBS domain-containing protein
VRWARGRAVRRQSVEGPRSSSRSSARAFVRHRTEISSHRAEHGDSLSSCRSIERIFQHLSGDPIMKLREIITEQVDSTRPDATLVDAAKLMMTSDRGWLPVAQGGKVVGVITDRDIAVRGVAGGMDPQSTRVDAIMSRDVLACSIDDDVDDACRTMEEEQVRRLVVVDENENLVGVVSLADLAERDEEESGEVLKKVTEPS